MLLWRMAVDADIRRRERNEKLSLTTMGVCFLAVAAYVGHESISDLVSRKAPEHSIPGIVLACVSLVVMLLLSGKEEGSHLLLTKTLLIVGQEGGTHREGGGPEKVRTSILATPNYAPVTRRRGSLLAKWRYRATRRGRQ